MRGRAKRSVDLRALLIAAFVVLSGPAAFAADHKPAHAVTDTPSGTQYFRLDPFVVPIMGREAVVRHLTIIVTLELTDDSKREGVREKLPLLRHALNTSLYQLIGIQRADGSLPPVVNMKRRMLEVTHDVTGSEAVREVLMESIYERKLR